MIRFASVACVVLSAGPSAFAGSLERFDLPGYTSTCGKSITDDGRVAGNSTNATLPTASFVYFKGKFTLLSPAFTTGTNFVAGVNHGGTVVGTNLVFGSNLATTSTGFTLRNGVTHVVSLRGGSNVETLGITDHGAILGVYQPDGSGRTLGFIKNGKATTTLDDGATYVNALAIDPTGSRAVGWSLWFPSFGQPQVPPPTAWIYQAGSFTPISGPNGALLLPNGINSAGTVVGTYATGTNSTSGFILIGAALTPFNVAGAASTSPAGINIRGDVTGCYTDSAGATHGFIYKPK
jgi:hypothetical protein